MVFATYRRRRLTLAAWLALTSVSLPATPHAAPYQRRWYVIAGGGAIASTDATSGYRVSGTVGQPITVERHPGSYEFVSGFWSGPFGSAFVGVVPEPPVAGAGFRIFGAVPNPTRDGATIAYDLPSQREVSVRVLDLQGRIVRTLARAVVPAGRQRVTWDGREDSGRPAPRGLYFVHVDAGQDQGVTRLVLLAEGGSR